GRTALPDMIQTSAPVNPGNSGGALADLSGQVVGMPTLGVTDPQLGPDAPGVGFAIPSNTVRDIATQLVERGRVVMSHRADLGVSVENVMGVGALVVSVDPGGPAARAGVQVDQMITSIAGRPTPSAGALAEALSELQPGETVPVVLVRPDESRTTIRVTLGRYPGG
ncbi:MAG TPA: PDZ domain-containing protein, partial [Acidimicrobiales bacterium]|nr:PDZ domain-containing protein [Acidimicrobiales bacterium]